MNISNNHDICKDNFKNIYSVDDYMVNIKNNIFFTPLCPFCSRKLYVRCKDNPNRRTHFSHYKNESCSLINYSNRFKNSNISPPSKQEVENIKVLFILYSYRIVEKIESILNIKLTPNDFLQTFKLINVNIFNCKNISPSAFTYIWINNLCPTNDITYIFSSTDSSKDLWEFNGIKDIINIVDFSKNKIIDTIETDYEFLNFLSPQLPNNFIISTYSELCNFLNLSDDTSDQLLKIILSKYITN